MKLAIPTNNGKLWPHFGKATLMTIATIENNTLKGKETVETPPHNHNVLADFLHEKGVTDVVCGGIGSGAINALTAKGINIQSGAPELEIDAVIQQYMDGTLECGDGTCTCHGEHEHEHQTGFRLDI